MTYNIFVQLNLDLLTHGDSPGIATLSYDEELSFLPWWISFDVYEIQEAGSQHTSPHEVVSPGHKRHMVDKIMTIVHSPSRWTQEIHGRWDCDHCP